MPYVYSTGTWGDLLTSYNGGSITYDSIGNPLSYYNGNNFTWEGRRLVGAVVGSKTLSFAYNDEGIRTSKTVNGVKTNYYYYGSQLLAEETNGNVTVYLYNSTGLIGFQYHGASYSATAWDTYFYEKNLQGDIVAVYDANGVKKISYIYNAWGATTTTYHNGASASTVSNPFTYRGYYYDKDLGLYYLMSRYYDANICRFINVDRQLNTTSLLSYNLFAYCENNPVVRIDPNGDFYITGTAVGYGLAYLCAAVVSTVAGVILADVISDVLNKLSAIFSRSKTEEIETPKSVTEAEEKEENNSEKNSNLKGEPGEVKKNGSSETHIGSDGKADRVRHNTDHGNPKYHSNPHDHDITWDSNGNPQFSEPHNYWDGNIPIFQ